MRAAGAAAVVVLLALLGVAASAQGAGELQGTITLRGGQTLTGKIQLAELGVVEGAGIGNSLPGHGAFILKVGDKTVRVEGDEVASVEVEWVNTGSDAEPRWEIKKLTVVKKDGTKVEGAPDWLLHATNVWVITADGETKRVHVFPFGNEPFNADNLIAKITVGAVPPTAAAGAEAAKPAETKPAETKPAETKPTETKPAAGKPSAPAPTQPTVPKPTTPTVTAPSKPPAKPPTQPETTKPAPTAKPPVTVVKPGAPGAEAAAGPVLAKDAMILVVRCPKCGELIKIIISADVVRIEHVPAGK